MARLLLGIPFKAARVIAITYIANRELDYIKAYRESRRNSAKKKKSQESDLELDNEESVGVKDIQIKKTVVTVLSMSTFLSAMIGPGKIP